MDEKRTARDSFSHLQFLYKDLGISSALLVFFAAGGRQIVRRPFGKTTLGLKVGEGLRREGDELAQAHFPRLGFHKLDQLFADAPVLMQRADIEACQFAFFCSEYTWSATQATGFLSISKIK